MVPQPAGVPVGLLGAASAVGVPASSDGTASLGSGAGVALLLALLLADGAGATSGVSLAVADGEGRDDGEAEGDAVSCGAAGRGSVTWLTVVPSPPDSD